MMSHLTKDNYSQWQEIVATHSSAEQFIIDAGRSLSGPQLNIVLRALENKAVPNVLITGVVGQEFLANGVNHLNLSIEGQPGDWSLLSVGARFRLETFGVRMGKTFVAGDLPSQALMHAAAERAVIRGNVGDAGMQYLLSGTYYIAGRLGDRCLQIARAGISPTLALVPWQAIDQMTEQERIEAVLQGLYQREQKIGACSLALNTEYERLRQQMAETQADTWLQTTLDGDGKDVPIKELRETWPVDWQQKKDAAFVALSGYDPQALYRDAFNLFQETSVMSLLDSRTPPVVVAGLTAGINLMKNGHGAICLLLNLENNPHPCGHNACSALTAGRLYCRGNLSPSVGKSGVKLVTTLPEREREFLKWQITAFLEAMQSGIGEKVYDRRLGEFANRFGGNPDAVVNEFQALVPLAEKQEPVLPNPPQSLYAPAA